MRVAALDFGTNTFILLVADVENGRIEHIIHDEVQVVRLGQGVHEARRFHPDALQRAEECLRRFSRTITETGATRVLAVATSAARDVTNGGELIALAARYRIPVQIISGAREAELTFLGTYRDTWTEPTAILDIGGGSTEFMMGAREGLIARASLDIGSVRLTEMFISGHPVAAPEMMQLMNHITEQLQEVRRRLPMEPVSKLVAVAGTPTTLAAVAQATPFVAERIDGYRLPLSTIRHWAGSLAEMSVEERQALIGMEPKRADVIVAGAVILMQTCQCFGIPEVEVSTRGLRYGIARTLALREEP